MEELKKIINDIFSEEIIKLVISNKSNKDVKYNKINILLKENKTKKYYQIEKFTDKQVFHENISLEEIETAVLEYTVGNYKQFTAWSNVTTYDVKISKKGKVHCSKKGGNNEKLAKKGHNKEKNYILKEGMIIEPLIDLGVFTKEGKVINSKYDKYKQINRFIEIIDDEIKKNDYKELTDMISSIMDDDVRTDYAVRARNKYDSLKDETVSWKKVVKAYEKQQKEENERLVEKKKNDSERALKNQIYKNKIELARTRIKRMHGYLYQPSNMQILIDSAKEALDACKGYSEYYNLKAMFDMYKKELEELPVKGESNKKNQTPTDTSEPVATEEPQEEE